MDAQHLIHMANQIGQFFEVMPDRQEALDGVATHLRKFWEPRMRRAIYAALDAGQADALRPLVREVLNARRAALEPVAAT